jgi:hypothetical protein
MSILKFDFTCFQIYISFIFREIWKFFCSKNIFSFKFSLTQIRICSKNHHFIILRRIVLRRKVLRSDDSLPESYQYFFVMAENSSPDSSSPESFARIILRRRATVIFSFKILLLFARTVFAGQIGPSVARNWTLRMLCDPLAGR